MNSILRWISPFLLALVTTTGIRLISDISTSSPFWNRAAAINLKDFIISIIGCYLLDFGLRYHIRRKNNDIQKGRQSFLDYAWIGLLIFIGTNISLVVAHYFIEYPNYLVDFIIAYVVVIPIGLFYYAMIRNTQIHKSYNEQALQLEKLRNKQLEAELDFLKAQYHPHFLFNALNTVYFQIDEEQEAAKRTTELLSDLLRYQLYGIKHEATMQQEIEYLETYIKFQQLRTNERLVIKTQFDPQLNTQKIQPLLFQPLIENAFKYIGGEYHLNISLKPEGNQIIFRIENSTPQPMPDSRKDKGIGINNLQRRLELLYPDKHSLRTEQKDNSFFAELIIETN
ncbi:MAG: histidine kinase [Prevotella sp.]|jgi:sensor histidine kinase YesM|nr:histidine kinase [Prevotella sp.]